MAVDIDTYVRAESDRHIKAKAEHGFLGKVAHIHPPASIDRDPDALNKPINRVDRSVQDDHGSAADRVHQME